MTTIIVSGSNPDIENIENKRDADISFSVADVSASLKTEVINTNYIGDNLSVILPNADEVIIKGSVYYTPVYKEKLNYEQWLKSNKNFRELT